MASFHTKVRSTKFMFEPYQFTRNLAAGITTADVGKAVSQDTSADNKVKLAGDGEEIVGVLYTVEDRVNEGQLVGTIEFHFAAKVPIKSGLTGAAAVSRGKRLIGAGSGEVKAIDLSGTPAATLTGIYATAPRVEAVEGLFAHAVKLA